MGNATTTLHVHNTTDADVTLRCHADEGVVVVPGTLTLAPGASNDMLLHRSGPGRFKASLFTRYPDGTIFKFSLGIEDQNTEDKVEILGDTVLVNGTSRGHVVVSPDLTPTPSSSRQASADSSLSLSQHSVPQANLDQRPLAAFQGLPKQWVDRPAIASVQALSSDLGGDQEPVDADWVVPPATEAPAAEAEDGVVVAQLGQVGGVTIDLQALVDQFRPVFWLHKKEEYLPSSVEEYLEHCELWFNNKKLLKEGHVDSRSLVSQTVEAGKERSTSRQAVGEDGRIPADKRWHLKCNQAFHCGVPVAELDSVPVYAHVTRDVVRGTHVIAINYITFYPYNGAYLVPLDESGNVNHLQGGHEADIEHVRVHVDAATMQLHSVRFSAHRERDGSFLMADKVECDDVEQDSVVCYVARNGHGLYPTAGNYRRLFFMANDSCSKGTLWRPRVVLLPQVDDEETIEELGLQWLWYCGCWGSDYKRFKHCSYKELEHGKISRTGGSPCGPAVQQWWLHEQCKTRHWFKRLFLPNAH
eukprot:m.252525 g.252525  ORF g.252525 m.252525 type:complete len:529 (-) comp19126_c0_seq13:162-1748(-)